MRACVGAMVRACDAMRLGLGGHGAMRNAMRSDDRTPSQGSYIREGSEIRLLGAGTL